MANQKNNQEEVMKKTRVALSLAVLLLMAGAAWAKIKTDYDHNANFARYKTYSWEKILNVVVSIVGQRAAGDAAPDQTFRAGVEHIDDQRSHLVVLDSCHGLAKPAPTPATTKAVIKGIQRGLIASRSDSSQNHVSTRWNF